ncbi:MAG: glucose-6-phosphate dehydrogenase, partial [Thermoguttaceae bacterium]
MYSIIIFGASGDLTSRKLIPALYELYRKGRLPQPMRILGFSRTEMSDEQWRNKLETTSREFLPKTFEQETWNNFASQIHYQSGDIGHSESFTDLQNRLAELEENGNSARLYYLSTAPQFYAEAILQLGNAGLAAESEGNSRRVVIEKPFGTDLNSARELNGIVHGVFSESQVYRIDHYLGKETVNNLLVLRFANTIFEPIWNRNYIEHVQITAGEDVLVGRRASYYEKAGVLRDMFQNHLLQLLTITAMEAPSRFEAKAVRDEKVKVLDAIRPMNSDEVMKNTVRGQY